MGKRWLVPLGVTAAWCALILLVHRDSPRTLVSAHGLLHVAIANEFTTDATQPPLATPPENPLFAGRPLPYYYFFHAVGARVAALLHVDVIHAFELLVLVAAAAVVLVGFQIGRWLHADPRASLPYGAAFALLFFAGCHPQGPLVLVARWIRHGGDLFTSRGFSADGAYLWGLVHPVSGAMRIGDPYGTLGPLATYFFNVTARPLALASLVVVIALLAPALGPTRRRRAPTLVAVALAMALCTLWSPLLGMASAGALAAALVVVAIRFHRPGRTEAFFRRRGTELAPEMLQKLVFWSRAEWRAQWLAAGALIVGVLLAWPWYRHLLGGSAGQVEFGFNGRRALGVVASAWLVALLAWGYPRWIWAEAVGFSQVLRLAGYLLAIPTAFIALPVGNEDNFLHAALVCWAFLAASAAVPIPADPPRPAEGEG